jgi:Ni,Fe-hydrogenase III large subunit
MEMPVTYTLALRPSAPALRHPARAVLKIDREQVAEVEYRPEASAVSPFTQAERLGVGRLIDEAGQLCPTCGFAHAVALCQAVEALAGIAPTRRAAWLRVAAAELERAGSHLATLAAIFETLGMAPLGAAFATQSEAARAARLALTGERPGEWLIPGGLSHDISAEARQLLGQAAADARDTLFPVADRAITTRALLSRTVDVGVISAGAAAQFGLGGPLARAAGLPADTRRDAPYAAYAELQPDATPQEGGDVYARILVLLLEALEALKLAERVAQELPEGKWRGELPGKLPAGSAASVVEAPRGPLRYSVESDGRRITAVTARTAPQLDRLLARTALVGATLDNVPLIIVSTDPCDACLAVHSR